MDKFTLCQLSEEYEHGENNEDTYLELRSFEFGTPLHHALFDGQHEIFELLISFGANVNSLTLARDSLLHSVSKMMKS